MTPDEEHDVAAREHALFQAIAPHLSALLDAYVLEGQRLQHAKPVLQLSLTVDSHTSAASSIAATLGAFTALARFARSRLHVHASQAHRRAFWMRVFASEMMARHWSHREHWEAAGTMPRRPGIATWMLEAPDFPAFRVHVVLRGQVGPALESMLACFKGSHATEHSDTTETPSAPAPISVTLDVSALDTAQPNFVANVVDLTRRLFASDTHNQQQQQFALQSVRYSSLFPFALQVALQRVRGLCPRVLRRLRLIQRDDNARRRRECARTHRCSAHAANL